jgi:signal peptidase II
VLVGVAAFVLAADAVTKSIVVAHLRPDQPVHVIGTVLMLWLTRNPGAAFSVGTGETIVFTVIACCVVAAIARTARNLRSIGWAIALGLLLGGAMGNLADRILRAPGLFRGDVVDWIAVTTWYPIFNLADSAIVCGGILTVVLAMRGNRLDGTRGDPARAAAIPATPTTIPATPTTIPAAPTTIPAAPTTAPAAPAAPAAPTTMDKSDMSADVARTDAER